MASWILRARRWAVDAKEQMAQPNPSNSNATSSLSPDDGIAVVELADELQIRKQTVFKVVRRLGIQAVKRRESDRRGQQISVIRRDEADSVQVVIDRADKFFGMMPVVPEVSEGESADYVFPNDAS